MQQIIWKTVENGGFLGVVNQSGHLIIAPTEDGFFQAMDSAEAADLRASKYGEIAALVQDAVQGKTDVRLVHYMDETYYAIGVPMETVGWTLLAAYSQTEAEQPIRQLESDFQTIQLEAVTAYRGRINQGRTLAWVILTVLLLVMQLGAFLMSKRIVKPLNTITQRIALSETNELFGTKRMIHALNARLDADPMEVLENMRSAVDGFVLDAEQFDDLTMLCLEYKGNSSKKKG